MKRNTIFLYLIVKSWNRSPWKVALYLYRNISVTETIQMTQIQSPVSKGPRWLFDGHLSTFTSAKNKLFARIKKFTGIVKEQPATNLEDNLEMWPLEHSQSIFMTYWPSFWPHKTDIWLDHRSHHDQYYDQSSRPSSKKCCI